MQVQPRGRRDRLVRALARLSLIGVLALMGAIFAGTAAAVGTPSDTEVVVGSQTYETGPDGALDEVKPVGLLIGSFVIGGGVLVLLVGAFKPPARRDERQPDELLHR